MSTTQSGVYAEEWARGVVNNLIKAHTRATYILLDLLQITPKQLTLYLRIHDPLWNRMRFHIHRYENWLNRGWLGIQNAYDIRQERWYFNHISDERLAKRLDSLYSCVRIEEQVNRGEAEDAKAADASPSFLPARGGTDAHV